MSDSDETICGNDSADENTENSPSILSNWHQEDTVFSTENEESLKKNSANEHEETSCGVDRMVESPEPEISPEFPLITRGLKRKDGYDETDEAPPIPKDVQSSTEFENISSASTMNTRSADDETRLERLLTNVEDFLKGMELTSKRENGASCNLGSLQNAKSQLEDLQKLLGETNRKNQAERRMILSEAGNSQQLPEGKKLIIVNLARKQRNLLEAFKKYKSLVQRLKTLKGLSGTSERSRQQNSVQTSTQFVQNRSSVSPPSSRPVQSPNKSVEDSSQNFHNPSTFTWQGGVPTPSLRTNVTNPALTKAVQQESVKFIVLQNYPKNSSQTFSKTHLNPPNSIRVADTASLEYGQTAVTQSLPQTVPAHHIKNLLINNTTASKQPAVSTEGSQSTTKAPGTTCVDRSLRDTTIASKQTLSQSRIQNIAVNKSLPQNQITASIVGTQSTRAPVTCVNSFSMIQRNQHPSMFRPTTQAPVPPNRPTTQVSLPQTFSQTSTTNSHTHKQDQPAARRLSTNQVQTIGVPMSNFPHSKTYQTTAIRQSNVLHSELSLEVLVKKGILIPGKNVLTTKSEGKLYSASLSDKGTIISAGGEGFTSPRSWVKAVLGSKRKVRNELAWKMVSYKNKPLLDHASTVAPETETSVNFSAEPNQALSTTSGNDTTRELITTTRALKTLLRNCRVIGITKEEVLSLEKTHEKFWEDADTELVDNDILKALDF